MTSRQSQRSQRNRPISGRPTRRSGRPDDPRNAVGRDAIIAATKELLKLQPPSMLGLIDIARFAKIDPSLIRYYFGTKDALLTAVAAEISMEMHGRIHDAVAAGRTSHEQLSNRVQAFLQMHSENPHLNQLILEYIVGSTENEARTARSHMVSDSVSTLKKILDDGERAGELASSDARLLHIALIGMCDFFFTGFPVLHEIYGKRASDPDLLKEYGAFISKLIIEGISPKQRKKKTSPSSV